MMGIFNVATKAPLRYFAFALALYAADVAVQGATATFDQPAIDIWQYGNVPTGGTYPVAPIFATLNSDDEDRMGTFLTGFNTASSVPAGRGAANYIVQSVKLTLTVSRDETFQYDPTYDSYQRYIQGDTSDDIGHPIEVYGVGLRGDYKKLAAAGNGQDSTLYYENSPFYLPSSTIRAAYPLSFNAAGD